MYATRFTDPYLFVKFAESVTLSDPATGEVLYFTSKPSDVAVNTSVSMGEIRAGIGNPVVAVLPSDTNVSVEITAADFNLRMRALQSGGLHGYGAPTLICVDVTATDATLMVNPAVTGTPVAGLGFDKPFCRIQTVGQGSALITDGVTYEIDDDGSVTGFAATVGTTYKVWYWVNKASTEYVTISSNMDPNVVNCQIVQPVFANESGSADNTGTRIGSLVTVIPYLKLGANAGVTGNNSSNSTTSVSGMAVAYEDAVVGGGCSACNDAASALAHYLYVPCEEAGMIEGLTVIGGNVSLPIETSAQIEAWLVVNGSLVKPDAAFMTYSGSWTGGASGGSVTQTGLVTAPDAASTGTFTATYSNNGETFSFSGALEAVED